MKPITTRKQHKAALARLEKLMDATRPTPKKAEIMRRLATRIERYEIRSFPI